MIEIALQDIEIDFGFKKVLDGASFTIQTGDKVALVGANGSGKSTILRIIMGLETYGKGQCTLRKGATLGYLDQESDIGDSSVTVEDFIKGAQRPAFELEARLRDFEMRMSQTGDNLDKLLSEYGRIQNEFIAIGGYELDENYSKICGAFKFGQEMLQKKCTELSGGQKTIVKLAKILLEAPDILILDEPTNHLDVGTLEWLEGFIREYRGTVLVVSHDRYFIDKTAQKTILLDQGKAEVFHGNYSFCLKEQERLMMLEFEQYKNQQKMIEAMKAAIKRFREWGERGDNKALFRKAANMEKRLARLETIEKPKLESDKLPIHFAMGKRSGKEVLVIKDLSFAYDTVPLFQSAGMEVLFRERVALIGPNGAGKSTLVKLILARGQGVALAESAKVGYVEQEISFRDENMTILSAFQEAAVVHENEARKRLAKFFITRDEVYKRLKSLSGGERVILRLAILMQQPINFLIFDEPTNHLDIDTKEILEESLADYKGTLLFIAHDRYFINRLATKVVYVEDQSLKSVHGNYDDYREAVHAKIP